MKESQFRVIVGATLILALYFSLDRLMLAIICLMAFEAITNYRIPVVVSKLRYRGQQQAYINPSNDCTMSFTRFNIEAERMVRVIIIFILVPSYFIYPDYLWFFSWFVAFALTGAGLSGICPMVIVLKKLGFR